MSSINIEYSPWENNKSHREKFKININREGVLIKLRVGECRKNNNPYWRTRENFKVGRVIAVSYYTY